MLFPDTLSVSSVLISAPVSIEEFEEAEVVVVLEPELLLLFPAEFEDVVDDPELAVPAVLPVLALLPEVEVPVPDLVLLDDEVLLVVELPEFVPEFPLYELYELYELLDELLELPPFITQEADAVSL